MIPFIILKDHIFVNIVKYSRKLQIVSGTSHLLSIRLSIHSQQSDYLVFIDNLQRGPENVHSLEKYEYIKQYAVQCSSADLELDSSYNQLL